MARTSYLCRAVSITLSIITNKVYEMAKQLFLGRRESYCARQFSALPSLIVS
jgi:hypothetical protein